MAVIWVRGWKYCWEYCTNITIKPKPAAVSTWPLKTSKDPAAITIARFRIDSPFIKGKSKPEYNCPLNIVFLTRSLYFWNWVTDWRWSPLVIMTCSPLICSLTYPFKLAISSCCKSRYFLALRMISQPSPKTKGVDAIVIRAIVLLMLIIIQIVPINKALCEIISKIASFIALKILSKSELKSANIFPSWWVSKYFTVNRCNLP